MLPRGVFWSTDICNQAASKGSLIPGAELQQQQGVICLLCTNCFLVPLHEAAKGLIAFRHQSSLINTKDSTKGEGEGEPPPPPLQQTIIKGGCPEDLCSLFKVGCQGAHGFRSWKGLNQDLFFPHSRLWRGYNEEICVYLFLFQYPRSEFQVEPNWEVLQNTFARELSQTPEFS